MSHHHVVATGLQLSTKYYYVVGDAAGGFSAVNSFTTAAGVDTTAFSVVSMGPHTTLLPGQFTCQMFRARVRVSFPAHLTPYNFTLLLTFTLQWSETRITTRSCSLPL